MRYTIDEQLEGLFGDTKRDLLMPIHEELSVYENKIPDFIFEAIEVKLIEMIPEVINAFKETIVEKNLLFQIKLLIFDALRKAQRDLFQMSLEGMNHLTNEEIKEYISLLKDYDLILANVFAQGWIAWTVEEKERLNTLN